MIFFKQHLIAITSITFDWYIINDLFVWLHGLLPFILSKWCLGIASLALLCLCLPSFDFVLDGNIDSVHAPAHYISLDNNDNDSSFHTEATTCPSSSTE